MSSEYKSLKRRSSIDEEKMLDVDGDGGPRKQSGRWWRGVLATHKHTGTGYTYLGKAMKVLSIRVPGIRARGR